MAQESKLQWLSNDERIVLEGAFTNLNRKYWEGWHADLSSTKNFDPETRRLVFASYLRLVLEGEMVDTIYAFKHDSEDAGPAYYVIGEKTEGSRKQWLPLSNNLLKSNPELLPLIEDATAPWYYQVFSRIRFVRDVGTAMILTTGAFGFGVFGFTFFMAVCSAIYALFALWTLLVNPIEAVLSSRRVREACERLSMSAEPTIPRWLIGRKARA